GPEEKPAIASFAHDPSLTCPRENFSLIPRPWQVERLKATQPSNSLWSAAYSQYSATYCS
ncbi:MAG: hypothetical protein ACKODZ_08320, partial [Verrucomicrobiota bacterium]